MSEEAFARVKSPDSPRFMQTEISKTFEKVIGNINEIPAN